MELIRESRVCPLATSTDHIISKDTFMGSCNSMDFLIQAADELSEETEWEEEEEEEEERCKPSFVGATATTRQSISQPPPPRAILSAPDSKRSTTMGRMRSVPDVRVVAVPAPYTRLAPPCHAKVPAPAGTSGFRWKHVVLVVAPEDRDATPIKVCYFAYDQTVEPLERFWSSTFKVFSGPSKTHANSTNDKATLEFLTSCAIAAGLDLRPLLSDPTSVNINERAAAFRRRKFGTAMRILGVSGGRFATEMFPKVDVDPIPMVIVVRREHLITPGAVNAKET